VEAEVKREAAAGLVALLLASCTQPAAPPVAKPAVNAESTTREVYDREERCGRMAREWFKQEWGDGQKNENGTSMMATAENHYNARLRKCFMLSSVSSFSTGGKTGKETHLETKSLTDFNDNHDVGTYVKTFDPPHLMQCTMDGEPCKSTDEWDAWAVKYMER
jgi:hypothetical protein